MVEVSIDQAEIDRCFRTSIVSGSKTHAEVEITFLRWQWFKLCVRTAWRMLWGARFRLFAWGPAASAIWAGLGVP